MKKGIDWEGRIGRRLRLRDLHVLLAVVQSGSMAKAAVALGVSQPVVSEAIADLEAAVGVRLVDRSRRGVTPTLYGEAILARSKIAFDELRQGIRDIEFLAEPSLGEVRIGCPRVARDRRASADHRRVLAPLSARALPGRADEHAQSAAGVSRIARTAARRRVGTGGRDARRRQVCRGSQCRAADRRSPARRRRHIEPVGRAAEDQARRTRRCGLDPPRNSWNSLRVEEAFAAIGMKMPEVIVDTFSVALRNQLLVTGRFVTAMPASTLGSQARDFAHQGLAGRRAEQGLARRNGHAEGAHPQPGREPFPRLRTPCDQQPGRRQCRHRWPGRGGPEAKLLGI